MPWKTIKIVVAACGACGQRATCWQGVGNRLRLSIALSPGNRVAVSTESGRAGLSINPHALTPAPHRSPGDTAATWPAPFCHQKGPARRGDRNRRSRTRPRHQSPRPAALVTDPAGAGGSVVTITGLCPSRHAAMNRRVPGAPADSFRDCHRAYALEHPKAGAARLLQRFPLN